MSLPPLVHYATPDEYKAHYKAMYCQSSIQTSDGIRVYFSLNSFDHMFFESSQRNGVKDTFSPVRAQRIDWIKKTLETASADLFQGWDKGKKKYDPTRRVAVVYEDFVVVVAMSLKRDNSLKANFVTCYQADNSIGKIRTSPAWSKADCILALGGTP